MLTDDIGALVQMAKQDNKALDALIDAYLPFIKDAIARITFKMQSQDDCLTIAMLAFAQSVRTYDPERGTFLAYARTVIASRLTDEARKEIRIHTPLVPLTTTIEEGDIQWETQSAIRAYQAQDEQCNLQYDIEALNIQFDAWGFDWQKLLKRCPKQDRSRRICHTVAKACLEQKELQAQMLLRRQLPMRDLSELSHVPIKTIEKYRVYIVAIILIKQGDYPYIHTFLPQFWGEEGSL